MSKYGHPTDNWCKNTSHTVQCIAKCDFYLKNWLFILLVAIQSMPLWMHRIEQQSCMSFPSIFYVWASNNFSVFCELSTMCIFQCEGLHLANIQHCRHYNGPYTDSLFSFSSISFHSNANLAAWNFLDIDDKRTGMTVCRSRATFSKHDALSTENQQIFRANFAILKTKFLVFFQQVANGHPYQTFTGSKVNKLLISVS